MSSNLYRLIENLIWDLYYKQRPKKLYMYKNGWGLHLKGCPQVFDFEIRVCKYSWQKSSFENLMNKFNKWEIFTKGWVLYLQGGPWSNWFRVLKAFEKKNPNSKYFQRIINLTWIKGVWVNTSMLWTSNNIKNEAKYWCVVWELIWIWKESQRNDF